MQWTLGDGLLAIGLLVAVYTDVKEQKIPNRLTLPLTGIGVLWHLVHGEWWLPLVGTVSAFLLHFGLWVLKVERGGDAKLMMAVGAFLGWSEMLEVTVWNLLLLVPVGVVVLALRGKLRNLVETLRFAWRRALGYPVEPPTEQTFMAYAPVIASAVVVARFVDWPSTLWT